MTASCLGRWLVNYEEQQKYTGCHNSSRGIVLMQLRVFLVLHLTPARMKIEAKGASWLWWPLKPWAHRCTHTSVEQWADWLNHTQVLRCPRYLPSLRLTSDTSLVLYQKRLVSPTGHGKYWGWKWWKRDAGSFFLLYKLALHLPCLCSQWYLPTPQSVAAGKDAVKKCNSNQWRKKQKRFLLRK